MSTPNNTDQINAGLQSIADLLKTIRMELQYHPFILKVNGNTGSIHLGRQHVLIDGIHYPTGTTSNNVNTQGTVDVTIYESSISGEVRYSNSIGQGELVPLYGMPLMDAIVSADDDIVIFGRFRK